MAAAEIADGVAVETACLVARHVKTVYCAAGHGDVCAVRGVVADRTAVDHGKGSAADVDVVRTFKEFGCRGRAVCVFAEIARSAEDEIILTCESSSTSVTASFGSR